MVSKEVRNKLLLGLSGLVVLALLFSAVFLKPDLDRDVHKVRRIVSQLLDLEKASPKAHLVAEESVRRRNPETKMEWTFVEERFTPDNALKLDAFLKEFELRLAVEGLSLKKSARTWPRSVVAEVYKEKHPLYRIILSSPAAPEEKEKRTERGPALQPGSGKIAIILDDWGYSTKQLPTLTSLKQPVTVSILPGLPHSAEVAQAAKRAGHQVMLHLPMESVNPRAPREKQTILTSMSREEAVDTMDRLLATVPHAVGLNNHQGSKATADTRLMDAIIGEAKRRGLFYVDSVTGQSVCADVAREHRIRFGQRAVFLDNRDDPEAIRRQFNLLAAEAAKSGGAIAIGHDRPVTMKVLQQLLPELQKLGYTIVHASELTKVSE